MNISSFLKFKYLPLLLIGFIYFPASLFGLIIFRDAASVVFLLLMMIFVGVYYLSYQLSVRVFYQTKNLLSDRISGLVHWRAVIIALLSFYFASMMYAVLSAEAIPLSVALGGGTLMEIAEARGQFLAGLEGAASVLRYVIFILGRVVMPLILVAAFYYLNWSRYILAFMLLLFSVLSLEKAAPIFTFLPLMLYFYWQKRVRVSVILCMMMLSVIFALTFLAMGGVGKAFYRSDITSAQVQEERVIEMKIPDDITKLDGPMGREGRFYLLHLAFPNMSIPVEPDSYLGKLIVITNRIVWIPYITAYDWINFHDDVLNGQLTMGRSISFIHNIYGEPKISLEKMVYVYQFGASPGGVGASNTVFFVDAKLAFGWVGVFVYCLIFTFCAACIFSSGNIILKVASVNCIFIASVSSLSATLLSGGLAIYVILAFLLPLGRNNESAPDSVLFPRSKKTLL